jgi:hypothetical protein
MKFEIGFNDTEYQNDKLLTKLGAKLVSTGSQKYPPFDNVDKIKAIVDTVDKELYAITSAIISFDPPTIYIDFMEKKIY